MDDRRDEWRRGVDENLASLNAGQRVWEREIGAIRKILSDIDFLLRGDPKKETDGLVARLHKQENEINLLKAIILKDAVGNKGLVGRVEQLEGGREDRRGLWKNLTSIVVAALMSGLLTHFWGDIWHWTTRKSTDPVEQMIERAKRPKSRRHHVSPAPVVEPETPED